VHAGIRRAQCFRCETVFGIEEAVAHLLAAQPEAGVPDPAPVPEPAVQDAGLVPEAAVLDLPPSLTLGDLETAEEESLDQTLITTPVLVAEAAPDAEDAPYTTSGPGYASAKDAIAKLMGAPLVPKAQPAAHPSHGAMDIEATLSAMDDTLGGQRVFEPKASEPLPERPPAPPVMNMASTMKLTHSEIQAALAAAAPASAVTAHLNTIPGPPPRTEPLPRAEPALPPPGLPPAQDPNLLKVQLEQEVYNNVTIEQMGVWVEEGRVHEYNMVARQFSEHWIEASKVPALRPIFEQRRRRQGPGQEELPIPPSEILPQKKGLFGGLFSRN
jgi:hypothetical protein